MRRYSRIILFFLVTYMFTWFGIVGNWLWPSDAWPFPMNPLGPLMAAFLMIPLLEGKKGYFAWWNRIIRFKAPWKVYAISIFIPSLIIVLSVLLAILFGAKPDMTKFILFTGGELFFLGLLLAPIYGPIPEETAFRGYAQDELQKKISPLAASLWIGLGVAIWHIPVLMLGMIPWPILFALPAVSVVYAWLYNTGGSVWPLVILHTMQNVVGAIIFGSLFSIPDNTLWVGFLTIFYIIWAIMLAYFTGKKLKSRVIN